MRMGWICPFWAILGICFSLPHICHNEISDPTVSWFHLCQVQKVCAQYLLRIYFLKLMLPVAFTIYILICYQISNYVASFRNLSSGACLEENTCVMGICLNFSSVLLFHLSTSLPLGSKASKVETKEEETFPPSVKHFSCVVLNLLPSYHLLSGIKLVAFCVFLHPLGLGPLRESEECLSSYLPSCLRSIIPLFHLLLFSSSFMGQFSSSWNRQTHVP